MTLDRIVVVGGSIAAVTAVETLRVEGFDGSITVLSGEPVPPYTRVPLSKGALAGNVSLEDVMLPPLSSEVDLRLHTRAQGLDVRSRLVYTGDGPVPYDGLVIATGARARRIGPPGRAENVVRDLEHCSALRTDLATASSVLVVGGGFLGMEIASTCRELGKAVTVVDREPPLERLLGPLVGECVRQAAGEAGVRFHIAPKGVELVGRSASAPSAVRTGDGEVLEADVVVSAVGDVPNVEWLAESGLAVDGGVRVDAWCRASPEIVAAGDVAAVAATSGPARRTPSWSNAVEQARSAARVLLRGSEAPAYRPSNYHWTEQFGLDVKMSGHLGPAGIPEVVAGSLDRRSALLVWRASGVAYCVMALNYGIRPAQLKRLARAVKPGAGMTTVDAVLTT
ncbi:MULTISPECIES: NAD(P)/FAD-dependent oxidoreductase [Amycolatopsis]|uniref:NAD(P)/FAD-dependent oxidoreductase n=1 Tax=Amycolatopsis TaxID=1813 RepID=UPI0033B2570B